MNDPLPQVILYLTLIQKPQVRTETVEEATFADIWLSDNRQVNPASQAFAASVVRQVALYLCCYFMNVPQNCCEFNRKLQSLCTSGDQRNEHRQTTKPIFCLWRANKLHVCIHLPIRTNVCSINICI